MIVDKFVIHDDVRWIKGGWINRNRILVSGQPHYITLPVLKGSNLLNINEREVSSDFEVHKKKILRQVEGAYGKAPHFKAVFALVQSCFSCEEKNVSKFIVNSLRECCDYLSIDTPIILSSELKKHNELNGEARVIDINNVLGANHYINPIGGTALYNQENFREKDIVLNYIKAKNVSYRQHQNDEFVPFLSIIDVMMFNSKEEMSSLLREYNLQ